MTGCEAKDLAKATASVQKTEGSSDGIISCCVPALPAFALCFAFACSLVGRRQSCDVWPDYVGLVSLYLYMCFICSVVVASMMSCGCRCCYVFLVVFACCVFLLVN